MFSLLVVLFFSAWIGYLAQSTGLCMVRGVNDWMNGRRARLLAILGTGFWVYLYFPLINPDETALHLQRHAPHWGFLFGGLIFGVGAAANGACSVSTASRLSSGDLRMIFTMVGWLAGWLLLVFSGVHFSYSGFGEASSWMPWMSWGVLGALFAASTFVFYRHRSIWRAWAGIMLVGILAGAVFLLQPAWSPSNFVKDLGLAIVLRNPDVLPVVERIAILAMMLLGMGISAWKYCRFRLIFPGARDVGRHFLAGILMGLGSAAALGGNDFQLLLAMPALSLAGFLAILGIVSGIRIGIAIIGNPVIVARQSRSC